MSDGNWQRVASDSDVKEGEAFPTHLGDVQIAIYRIDGKLYALDDVCTHAFALLSQGFIEGHEIECPLHQARFEIATGRCTAPPADRDLRTYEVRLDGPDIMVRAGKAV